MPGTLLGSGHGLAYWVVMENNFNAERVRRINRSICGLTPCSYKYFACENVSDMSFLLPDSAEMPERQYPYREKIRTPEFESSHTCSARSSVGHAAESVRHRHNKAPKEENAMDNHHVFQPFVRPVIRLDG